MIATGASTDHAGSLIVIPSVVHHTSFMQMPSRHTRQLPALFLTWIPDFSWSPPEQYAALKNLSFSQGSHFRTFPNAQIWPGALNTNIRGVTRNIYLVIADVCITFPSIALHHDWWWNLYSIGATSGSGFDFISGYTFLEQFYSVFDGG